MVSNLITHITADNSQFKKAMNEASQAAAKFSTTVGKSINTTVTRYGALFSGFYTIKSLLTSSVRAAYDFSKQMSLVQSMTQASADQMKIMESAAKRMSANSIFSSADIARAMQITGNVRGELFDNPQALIATTQHVLDFSQAMGVSTEQAAQTLGSSLNQFGASTDEAGHYANMIAAATKYGAAEADDLAVSLSYVGGTAHQMGLSLEETLGVLEGLSRSGIRGSKAGTSFNRVLLGLATTNDLDINPQVVGWQKAMDNLSKKTLSVAESQKLFSQWGQKAGLSIQQQSKYITEIIPKIRDYNSLTDQAAQRQKSFFGRMEQFKNAGKNFGIALVDAVGDAESGGGLGSWTWFLNNESKGLQDYGLRSMLPGYQTITEGNDFLFNRLLGIDKNKIQYDPNQSGQGMSHIASLDLMRQDRYDKSIQEFIRGTEKLKSSLEKAGLDVGKSFIPNLLTGAKSLESFTESVTDASKRLQNGFQSLSDDMESGAKSSLMEKIFKPSRDKFNKAIEEGVSDSFISKAQDIIGLTEQYRFETNESKKAALYDRIGMLQENLTNDVWNSQGGMSAGTFNGGTFSTFGAGTNGESLSLEKSILLDLSKRINQVTEKDNQVTITGTVEVKPDTPTFIKFTKASFNQVVAEEAAGTSL